MARSAADLWRGVAAVAVVAIHAAGGFEGRGPFGAAEAVSQWARFSVPLFMVFSGFGLARSEAAKGIDRFDRAASSAFWRRRAPRIGLPYLLFTLAGLAWAGRLTADAIPGALLRGTGDYHLYFLAFLLQGYLIWPLLRRASWGAVVGLLALQVLLSSPAHVLWPGRPHIPAWIIVHWAGYVALGARLARSDVAWTGRAGLAGLAAIVTLGAVVAEYVFWAARSSNPGDYNHFCRWVVIAYALATVWLWRSTADAVAARLAAHRTRLARVAGLTFTVYLIHPWILRAMGPLPFEPGFTLRWLLATALSFAAAALAERALRGERWRWPRRAIGLG